MKLSNLIFGVALLLVAATLALTITFRNSPDEGDDVALPAGKAEYSKRGTGSLPSRTSASPAAMRSNPTRGAQPRLPKVEELEVTIDDGPATQGMTPAQRQDVAKRLPWVRKNALSRLSRMTDRLDLTPAQRQKVFPQLLRSTSGYHPAMIISYPAQVTAPAESLAESEKTPDEAIHDSLDPEQQDDFIQQKLDDQAWWEEIVAQLEEDFDASVTADEDAITAGQAPPSPGQSTTPQAEPQPQQGINLFDLLDE